MLTPWKESYEQPRQHIKKQRHYFAIKVHLVKAMVFPVVMYGCESWTIKKPQSWRIDAFELWCWRLFRVPWTARRSKQSTLKDISSEFLSSLYYIILISSNLAGYVYQNTAICHILIIINLCLLDWCWSWISNTLPTWREEWTNWKRPWCWERLKAEEKGTTEDEMCG